MAKEFFIGKTNNTAKKPSKILVGNSSNIAKEVKSIFVGNSSNQAVKVFPSFPDIYQKIEYIYNSGGTQYINTNVKVNSDTRIFIDLKVIDYATYSQGEYLMTGCNQPDATNYSSFYITTVRDDLGYSWGNSSGSISSGAKNRHTFKVNRDYDGKTYLDNTQLFSSTSTFSTVTNDYILFGVMSSGSVTICQRVHFNLYSFQVWQSGTMIRDMYPCYLKSDTLVVGMYDIINEQFYGNSGTGIFYKGPNVN